MPSCLNAFYQWSTALTMFTAYMSTWRRGKFWDNTDLSKWSFPNLRFKFYLIIEKLAKCYNSHFGTNNVFLTEDRYLKLFLALFPSHPIRPLVLVAPRCHIHPDGFILCEGCRCTGRTGRWSRQTSIAWETCLWGTQLGGISCKEHNLGVFLVSGALECIS